MHVRDFGLNKADARVRKDMGKRIIELEKKRMKRIENVIEQGRIHGRIGRVRVGWGSIVVGQGQ